VGPLAKLRLAATLWLTSRRTNWRALEDLTLEEYLRRWSGDRAFETMMLPLFRPSSARWRGRTTSWAPGSLARSGGGAALFGDFADVRRPVAPYRWSLASEALIEIPVTTVPFLRLPFHLSYILYLASFSTAVALAYLRMALFLCRATSTPPSFLLHPLDFLGFDSGVGLEFFPAMRLEHRRQCDLARRAVALLCSEYEPAGLRRLAQAIAEGRKLASRVPSFPRRQGERPA